MSSEPLDGHSELFPVSDFTTGKPQRKYKPLSQPLWTTSKAQLVARYLHYFVFVTKHGTYLDLFAGRQSAHAVEGWTAEQVLVMQPKAFHLRRYFWFENSRSSIQGLYTLKSQHNDRQIEVIEGDCNRTVVDTFAPGILGDKEATFCLLDQRAMECEWSTCRYLSTLKSGGYKPELFYFLAQGWLARTIAAISTPEGEARARAWWGRDDWQDLRPLDRLQRAEYFANRFRDELGYQEATPWPIYAREGGGRIMYDMIHATDHPDAPPLMRRAYEWAVAPVHETEEQLEIDLGSLLY